MAIIVQEMEEWDSIVLICWPTMVISGKRMIVSCIKHGNLSNGKIKDSAVIPSKT